MSLLQNFIERGTMLLCCLMYLRKPHNISSSEVSLWWKKAHTVYMPCAFYRTRQTDSLPCATSEHTVNLQFLVMSQWPRGQGKKKLK